MDLYRYHLNTKLPDYAPHQVPWVMARMNHKANTDDGVHLQRMAPVGSLGWVDMTSAEWGDS